MVEVVDHLITGCLVNNAHAFQNAPHPMKSEYWRQRAEIAGIFCVLVGLLMAAIEIRQAKKQLEALEKLIHLAWTGQSLVSRRFNRDREKAHDECFMPSFI